METLGQRIRYARMKSKLSQTALGKPFGISREAVSFWESDTNAPTLDKLGKIAELTGVSAEFLMSGKEHSGLQTEIPHPLEFTRDMPVRGTAVGGKDGAFVFESTIIDMVRRPPRLRGIKDAYALYVQGSSMAPWREEGQLVFVHPHQKPQIGDYVVVQTGSNEKATAAYIKRLVRRSASEVRLSQFQPAEELSIPTKRIISIHRIMDWSELMGL